MSKVERLIIYTLLAVMALATFTNRGLIQAKDKPEEATFRKLTIVDEKGKKRIEIGHIPVPAQDVDRYGVQLYDEDGHERVSLDAAKVGPVLAFTDEKGQDRVLLGTVFDISALLFKDDKGQSRTMLRALKDGADVSLYDDKGKPRAMLVVFKGEPGLALADEKGEVRAVLDMDKERPRLALKDEKGQTIWTAP